ncbi:unnamed protein product [marine sediment metagenome]|uniref:Uncharacterized protein n=1 Tax=marine sediment metagenome TaxID=412755 RepID=X1C3G6_9ZZZZ
MPYRPVSEPRRKRLEERITLKEKSIAVDQAYVASMRQELEQGEFYYDIDWSTIPMPKPDCYICGFATAIRTCSKGYTYDVPCNEYVHFSKLTK